MCWSCSLHLWYSLFMSYPQSRKAGICDTPSLCLTLKAGKLASVILSLYVLPSKQESWHLWYSLCLTLKAGTLASVILSLYVFPQNKKACIYDTPSLWLPPKVGKLSYVILPLYVSLKGNLASVILSLYVSLKGKLASVILSLCHSTAKLLRQ